MYNNIATTTKKKARLILMLLQLIRFILHMYIVVLGNSLQEVLQTAHSPLQVLLQEITKTAMQYFLVILSNSAQSLAVWLYTRSLNCITILHSIL